MVELINAINFCNLLTIIGFFITVISNYTIISKRFNALIFIVNTFILCMTFVLALLKIYPEKIDIDINIVNFSIQFLCGIFMLGLSDISICIGILCILGSLLNIFYVIFRHSISENSTDGLTEVSEENN
tara:strand:+ start:14 stop:400 length:387 start_codon:yes stop_codon:yes gene_type:complete